MQRNRAAQKQEQRISESSKTRIFEYTVSPCFKHPSLLHAATVNNSLQPRTKGQSRKYRDNYLTMSALLVEKSRPNYKVQTLYRVRVFLPKLAKISKLRYRSCMERGYKTLHAYFRASERSASAVDAVQR